VSVLPLKNTNHGQQNNKSTTQSRITSPTTMLVDVPLLFIVVQLYGIICAQEPMCTPTELLLTERIVDLERDLKTTKDQLDGLEHKYRVSSSLGLNGFV